MLGLNAYYRLRGCEIFRDPFVLWQFQSDRFSMITAAIAARRRTCLALDEWKTYPWLYAQNVKRPRQYLLDYTSRLPELYVDFIHYLKIKNLEDRATMRAELESKMADLLHFLRIWELEWRFEDNVSVEKASVSAMAKEKIGSATKLIFDDIDDTAYTFVVYNTTLIILIELWKAVRKADIPTYTTDENLPEALMQQLPKAEASDFLLDLEGNDTSITTPSLMSQSRKAALDICRTLPNYQNSSGTWIHAIQLVPAIRMALVVFRQEEGSPQASWLEDVSRQIGDSRQGWEIGKYTMQKFQ